MLLFGYPLSSFYGHLYSNPGGGDPITLHNFLDSSWVNTAEHLHPPYLFFLFDSFQVGDTLNELNIFSIALFRFLSLQMDILILLRLFSRVPSQTYQCFSEVPDISFSGIFFSPLSYHSTYLSNKGSLIVLNLYVELFLSISLPSEGSLRLLTPEETIPKISSIYSRYFLFVISISKSGVIPDEESIYPSPISIPYTTSL